MAGVNDNVVVLQESNGEILVGDVRRDTQDRVPAGIGVKEFAGRVLTQERLQSGVIFADAGEKLSA